MFVYNSFGTVKKLTWNLYYFGKFVASHKSRETSAPTSTCSSVASITCWFERSQWGCVFLQYLSPAGSDQDSPSLQFKWLRPRFTWNMFRTNKNTSKNKFCTKGTKKWKWSIDWIEPDAVSRSDDSFFHENCCQV